MPPKANTIFIANCEVLALKPVTTANAIAKSATPDKIVFLLPILLAKIPAGMYATIAAACATRRVVL